MSVKHLDRYVQEFAGRHNIRGLDTIDQMRQVARKNGTPEALDKSIFFSYILAMDREQAGRGGL